MNYQNWSKLKFWVIILGVFILGVVVAPKNPTQKVTEVVYKDKEVGQECPACCDYSNWRTLKEIDDEGFDLSAEGMELCSQGFYAASEFDTSKLLQINADMKALTPQLNSLGVKRQSILRVLGY